MAKWIRRAFHTATLLLFPLAPADASAQDGRSPEAIVSAAYEVIGRAPGEAFRWDRFRALFLPEAHLIPNTEQTGGAFRVLTVEDFIDWINRATVIGGPDDRGFSEFEISNRVEQYGDIANVFSTYGKRFWGEPEIVGRGINSFQVVRKDGRWWIASIIWDEENGAGPLPARYGGN